MTTIAELIVTALAEHGVRQVWGVVGDALNPVTDAIRREERIEWVGVRHEEAGAFAASAQAQLTDDLAVCMGTVGPGAVHLLNGLYDAKKSHAPVLAIVGQVPREDIGTDYFQETRPELIFADCTRYVGYITSPAQMPRLAALALSFVGFSAIVVTLRGALGGKLSDRHLRLVRLYIEGGLVVTALGLVPALLNLLQIPGAATW